MKRYVKIELIDWPALCPARVISKDGRAHCKYTVEMDDCPSRTVFPSNCPLSEADDI